MAELADAADSKSAGETRVGSSPTARISSFFKKDPYLRSSGVVIFIFS